MGYRNIKPVLTNIWELSGNCGLFTGETELNNGYGCKSRSKDKDDVGKCYAWDCPLGYSTSLDDLKKYDRDLYNEYLEDGDPEQSGWMIQWRELASMNFMRYKEDAYTRGRPAAVYNGSPKSIHNKQSNSLREKTASNKLSPKPPIELEVLTDAYLANKADSISVADDILRKWQTYYS